MVKSINELSRIPKIKVKTKNQFFFYLKKHNWLELKTVTVWTEQKTKKKEIQNSERKIADSPQN